jgi:hypothetical protein
MKSIISGIAVAVLIAIGAAVVLDGSMQRSVEDQFQTSGVRL